MPAGRFSRASAVPSVCALLSAAGMSLWKPKLLVSALLFSFFHFCVPCFQPLVCLSGNRNYSSVRSAQRSAYTHASSRDLHLKPLRLLVYAALKLLVYAARRQAHMHASSRRILRAAYTSSLRGY
jgi:hypothetical protein